MIKSKYVTVNGDIMTVESGALVDTTGTGYGASQGPGGGTGSSGGSYASSGGNVASGNQYGSIYQPAEPGSGGGYGAGGGWLKVDVGLKLIIDGLVKADGVPSSSSLGGGSGGTIILQTSHFKGYGTVQTIGGKTLCSTMVMLDLVGIRNIFWGDT